MQAKHDWVTACFLVVAIAAGLAQVPCHAQTSPRLPPQVKPHSPTPMTIEAETRAPIRPVESEVRRIAQLAPPGADRIAIDFEGLRFDGGSVYSAEDLAPFYEGLIGRKISLAHIYEIAASIQDRYRDDGYLLARVVVPEQTVADGVFTLRIVEGFIAAVRIEGDVDRLRDRLETYLSQVKGLRPVNRHQIDRCLLLINDLPGVVARGILRPATGELGASELVLRVEHDPFDFIAVANNRGSEYTGPVRAMAVGRLNSAFGGGEGLELLVMSTIGNDEQRYGQLVYGQPLGANGLSVGVLASYGPSEPGSTFRSLGLKTTTERLRLSMSYPLSRTRNSSWFIDGGFEATESDVELLDQTFSNDKIRALYAGSRWDFVGRRSNTNVRLDIRQGIDALGATSDSARDVSRLEGKNDFTSLRFFGSHLRGTFGATSLFAAVVAQYSADPLLAEEEFRVGGEHFGRGYDPAEIAGDSGIAFSGESRLSGATGWKALESYQIYGFYDVGVVWNEDTGVDRRESLASAGIGLRARVYGNFDLGFEFAKPLTRVVASEGNRDPRWFFHFTLRL